MGCLCNFAQTRIEASPPSKWWVCQRDNSAVGTEATHRRRGRLILRRFPGDSRSGLVNILARWARGLVCFEHVIRECHTHGRLHVRLEWISTDRAVFQLASVDQMRIWFRPMYFMRFLCHADSLRRSCRHQCPVEIKLHHYLERI